MRFEIERDERRVASVTWEGPGQVAVLVDDPADWTGTLKTAIQPTYWHGLDLIAAVRRALALRRHPLGWERVMHTGMGQALSWDGPARAYLDLYARLVDAR